MPFLLKYYEENPYTRLDLDRPLYHYTKLENLKSILTNKSLRFRKNNFSNDKDDGKIISLTKGVITKISKVNNLESDTHWELYKNLCYDYMKFIEHFTINKEMPFEKVRFPSMFNFCLSKTIEKDKLWEDYANNEVCIEFSEHFLRGLLTTHLKLMKLNIICPLVRI